MISEASGNIKDLLKHVAQLWSHQTTRNKLIIQAWMRKNESSGWRTWVMCLQKKWIFWLRKNHLHEKYLGFTNLLVGAHQDFASSEDFPCEFKMFCLLMCAECCWRGKNNVHICVPTARRRLSAYFAKYVQNIFLSTKKPAAKKMPPAGPLPQDKFTCFETFRTILWSFCDKTIFLGHSMIHFFPKIRESPSERG